MHMYISAEKKQLCLPVVPKQSWPSVHRPHANPLSREKAQQRRAQNCPDKWKECSKREEDTAEHDTEAGAHQLVGGSSGERGLGLVPLTSRALVRDVWMARGKCTLYKGL